MISHSVSSHERVLSDPRITLKFVPGLLALLVIGLIFGLPSSGWCGAIFDRVMKQGTVRIGVPYNRMPQGFLNSEEKLAGFEVDLAAEIAGHMGLKLDTVKVSDKSWGPSILKGRIDAALCRIRQTRSLENQFDFSIPYFFDSMHVLVRKGETGALGDLKGNKIAALQGSRAEKLAMSILREAGDEEAEKNVVSYPDRPSCFMALGKEKVSGWMDSGMTLLEYASRKPGRFQLIKASDRIEGVAVALAQDDSAWRDLVNFTIQDLADDGTLKKLYDKWFGPDTAYAFPMLRAVETWPN
ncbi:transporter substrate-binding domain-containing protein [Thermodesulfobacteriota bacterium]